MTRSQQSSSFFIAKESSPSSFKFEMLTYSANQKLGLHRLSRILPTSDYLNGKYFVAATVGLRI